jgi:hypothetical protein
MTSLGDLEGQVNEATQTYLAAVLAGVREALAEGRLTDVQPVIALGVLQDWYTEAVQEPVVETIRAMWEAAFPTPSPANADARAMHLAAVTDRLSRRVEPSLPEAAMDQVRLSQSLAALEGWTPQEMARDIAERLAWEPNKDYWKAQKKKAEDAIDAILDPLGPPGTPERMAVHANDPRIKDLQAVRAEAVDRIREHESLWAVRAKRIARTEFTGMQNAGALAALIDEGVTHKRWLATDDERTRIEHREADGQVRRIDEPFIVGGFALMMPGDPTAPPHLTVNCRCSIIGADAPKRAALTAAGDGWKTQLRVPKGNGKYSGRWLTTPWAFMDSAWNGIMEAKWDDDQAKWDEVVKSMHNAQQILTNSPWDGTNPGDPEVKHAVTTAVGHLWKADERLNGWTKDQHVPEDRKALREAIRGMETWLDQDWSLFDETTDVGTGDPDLLADLAPTKLPKDWTPGDTFELFGFHHKVEKVEIHSDGTVAVFPTDASETFGQPILFDPAGNLKFTKDYPTYTGPAAPGSLPTAPGGITEVTDAEGPLSWKPGSTLTITNPVYSPGALPFVVTVESVSPLDADGTYPVKVKQASGSVIDLYFTEDGDLWGAEGSTTTVTPPEPPVTLISADPAGDPKTWIEGQEIQGTGSGETHKISTIAVAANGDHAITTDNGTVLYFTPTGENIDTGEQYSVVDPLVLDSGVPSPDRWPVGSQFEDQASGDVLTVKSVTKTPKGFTIMTEESPYPYNLDKDGLDLDSGMYATYLGAPSKPPPPPGLWMPGDEFDLAGTHHTVVNTKDNPDGTVTVLTDHMPVTINPDGTSTGGAPVENFLVGGQAPTSPEPNVSLWSPGDQVEVDGTVYTIEKVEEGPNDYLVTFEEEGSPSVFIDPQSNKDFGPGQHETTWVAAGQVAPGGDEDDDLPEVENAYDLKPGDTIQTSNGLQHVIISVGPGHEPDTVQIETDKTTLVLDADGISAQSGLPVYLVQSGEPPPQQQPSPLDLDTLPEPIPDVTGWKKISGPKGSNPGGVYEDENGKRHYVKQSKSDLHAKNEALTARLYALAGIKTTNPQLVVTDDEGRLGTSAEMLDGTVGLNTEARKKMRKGFAADVWLANWDVVGLTEDNALTTPDGTLVRVDLGGSLLFRAQGGPKGDAFGESASEWVSMRSHTKNPQAANVFGSMSGAELQESAETLLFISNADIDAAVNDIFGAEDPVGTKLKVTLKARRDDVLKRAGVEKPETAPDPLPPPTPGTKAATEITVPSSEIVPGDVLALSGAVLKKSGGKLVPAVMGKQGKHDDQPEVATVVQGKIWTTITTTTGQQLWIEQGVSVPIEREVEPAEIEVPGTKIEIGDVLQLQQIGGTVLKKSGGKLVPAESGYQGKHESQPTVASVSHGTIWTTVTTTTGQKLWIGHGQTTAVIRTPGSAKPGAKIDGKTTWKNKPAPVMPTMPDEPKPDKPTKAAWASWLAKVEARYKANPNAAKSSVQQSNKWGQIQKVMDVEGGSGGVKSNLDALLAKQYLDQALYDEALAVIEEAKQGFAGKHAKWEKDKAAWEIAKAAWEADYAAWRKENPTSLLGMAGAQPWMGMSWQDMNQRAQEIFYEPSSSGALSSFTGGGYTGINGGLRDVPPQPIPPSLVSKVSVLDKATKHPTQADAYLFRGDGGKMFGIPAPSLPELEAMIGQVKTQNAYMSTSIGSGAAFSHMKYQVVFRAPAGTHGGWVANKSSVGTGEREFLLARGTQYVIHAVEYRNGTYFVQAEILPPGSGEPDNPQALPLPPPPGMIGTHFQADTEAL